jgi:hypothetical protein
MIKLQGDKLDRTYISAWASKLGVVSEWTMVRRQTGDTKPEGEGP